ncbi:GFO-IDH-MocA domain-containing protein [Fusarium keratoplasticum]|uniref:GFO-IDH-MocA domain-containing protein n=1 Tax=Fusarium keratoplasticum TaxID=1328300 RepID=A0ACC0QJ04_9HYPO|nr:GFO-IDH-MocA domain-containing protein [Fusarium keratoplasticum]KAI8652788.1 GFO-IDH-MocA domain-containing protein [Fusarium keratoplasticum]
MAKTPIPVGFVGLSSKPEWSWAVAAHLPYFAQSANYKIAALQNNSVETAKKAIEVHKLGDDVHAHGDVQSIASNPNIGLVATAVKVPLHAVAIEAALNAKKSVFCEQSPARNAAQAECLASLAQQKGAKTLIGLQGRQDPAVLKAKEMVAAGDMEDILQTTMLFTSPWFGATMPESNVYGVDIENGANLMTISVGHSLHTLCDVLGELHGIQATLANNRGHCH